MRPFLDEQHLQLAHRLSLYSQVLATFPVPQNDAEARVQARQLLHHMGNASWLHFFSSPIDSRSLCLIRESLAAVSPLADDLFAVQGLATQPLCLEGSTAQRHKWVPASVAGSLIGAFALTEKEAGSDVRNLQTSATPHENHYLLNGSKTLISNAGLADYYIVFARLKDAIAAFLVEADQVHFAGPQILSAPHPLGELEFKDAHAELICKEGFKLAMRTLDALRVTVAASACGMAGRALKEALQHAKTRRQFGKPIADFQIIQQKLASMAIQLDAARLLTYRAAWQRDQGELRNSREVAMAKAFATESAQQIIDQSLQILGGQGMLANHPVEHLYRAIRALRIYAGTTEIQHLIIAKDMLKA